jgi:hypothetical protein
MDKNDVKHAHLEMIQGVINRLAGNSFMLKGWSVVLVSGLFALAAKGTRPFFVCIAYFPCLVFWGLDGYFLWQERLFRSLFNAVRKSDSPSIDYSMDTSQVSASAKSWLSAVFSRTLIAFHGAVFVTIIIVMLLLMRT